MKVISALLAMTVSALAASSNPGESALEFLEKVRTKRLNLEPGGDTALSPHTSSEKRREIARRLDRLADDLGNGALELGPVKLGHGYAAVLVRNTGGFDPSRLQVFPVALIQRGAEWIAAPVPASFENAGAGYTAKVREQLETLEDWMLRERTADLEKLRDQSAARVRGTIEARLSAAALRKPGAPAIVEDFLAACERRDLAQILGFLGGLDSPLPNDWPLRIKAAENAIAAGPEVKQPWRLLIAPEVLRLPVAHEGDETSATVSIACLDPAGAPDRQQQPEIQLIHLELSKSRNGLWRIDLPAGLLRESSHEEFTADQELDAGLLDAFSRKLAAKYPRAPRPTTEEAANALVAALSSPSPAQLLGSFRIPGDPKTARLSCKEAVRLWWSCHDPANPRISNLLAFSESGTRAAAAYQLVTARNLERLNLQILYFEKTADGWFWLPNPDSKTGQIFRDWSELQNQRWQNEWPAKLLESSLQIEAVPAGDAPSEEAARKTIESWIATVRAGDALAALRLTARLGHPKSDSSLLRNLGYEIAGARRQNHPPAITGIHRGRFLTAVGARTVQDGNPSFPLYPVVMTPAGPRILLEIDLFAAAARSREFLNRTALERVREFSPAVADDAAELLSKHQAATTESPSP